MIFELKKKDESTAARAGLLKTARGDIQTPIFMPVGTLGTVKTIQQYDLIDEVEAEIILGNTYHLYLRPGLEILQQAGGLHAFMNWDRPILTDSGGYQVYSLSSKRKISEEGVRFSSHIDGSTHFFTPEGVMDIQRVIGSDIAMAFDECPPYPCTYEYAKDSLDLTNRWLDRCIKQHQSADPLYGFPQELAPIVQGSTFEDLRAQSAEYVASKDKMVNAIGGLSVGEPADIMYEMTELCCGILPEDRARYLMGVGTPENLLECIALGVDMFDCVLPTRNARHGMLYTSRGRINIRNARWKEDFSPLDPDENAKVDAYYSKAYVRHLFMTKEYLGIQIASLHNLAFFLRLVKTAREKILQGTFGDWKAKMIPALVERL